MMKLFFIASIALLATMLFACGTTPSATSDFNQTVSEGENGVLSAPAENPIIPSENPTVPTENPTVPAEKPENPETPAPAVPQENKAVYIRSKTDGLNVRRGAGTNYSSLGTLDKGDMVVFLEKIGGWYKTYFRSQTAYVSADENYTDIYKMDKGNDNIEAVINVGLKLLGTPYVYGATRYHNGNGTKLSGFSTDAFDCSSLMQYMYYVGANVNLDLTTRTQIKQGTKVSTLKRGDLMFFTNATRKDKTGIERVGHVALFLGDNYILHTASDHAVIEQISQTRWSYYIQANRMI